MTLADELLAYYRENVKDFNDDIEELNNWNGCLYDNKIYPMGELNDFFQDTEPDEILRSSFYGYDEPLNKDEDEERKPFNPNRNYFYFNGYGNLVSIDEKDYSSYLEEYFIQDIIDNRYNLSLSIGAEEIIDEYELENE